ncbi:MAG: sulfatase-like hydrolase/transferase [Oscillospiraceae bacterium]|nr:sulfatase-like hydrolase/transferase [Oscillospiraceae bacterium]
MKKPNLLFFGIDSLTAQRMSTFGYERLTTPHIDELAAEGVSFKNCFSPSIPTPPGYSALFTGRDCFGTDIVTLRLENGIPDDVPTMAEILNGEGYNTTCVGFQNEVARGFQNYIDYEGWAGNVQDRAPKAERLNAVAIPELKRLAGEDKPFLLFLRHMDPHSPYLPPRPFERIFYDGDEFDPNNKSLDEVMTFKPFCDYFASWFPERCTDDKYIEAQYDGAIAYMDACIKNILTTLDSLGIRDETIVVITSDHGETLNQHDCHFDHHGLYECTLRVPMILRWPGVIPEGWQFDDFIQQKDLLPTLLELMGIEKGIKFDGRTLSPIWTDSPAENREHRAQETEFYITECTWMRKHGWRTPEWKLIRALEPDFHFKPPVELYNLINDPEELNNVAESEPGVVALLTERMEAHIKRREADVGRKNPMFRNENWNSKGHYFTSSEEAYNSMHIGDSGAAAKLQRKNDE